jgi:uracil-DNA glycosylase family 4
LKTNADVGYLMSSNKELLDNVATEVVVCTKCCLWKNRKKAVPGVGNPESKLMLVGEAPGRSEDIQGEPFVGAAGKLLDTLLSEIGLSRTQVFITNVVKCRPPENRDPLPDEIETCTPYLNRQIGIIQPAMIITLGKHSTAYVLGRANLPFSSITQEHGKAHEAVILGVETVIFPTFHPAATLYNAQYENQIRDDFQIMKKELLKREPVTQ